MEFDLLGDDCIITLIVILVAIKAKFVLISMNALKKFIIAIKMRHVKIMKVVFHVHAIKAGLDQLMAKMAVLIMTNVRLEFKILYHADLDINEIGATSNNETVLIPQIFVPNGQYVQTLV